MKLYTLAKPFPANDNKSCLNGKMFFLVTKEGVVRFLDLDHNTIWETTQIVSKTRNGAELTITTKNTCYQFIEVSSLLPTKVSEPKDDAAPAQKTKKQKPVTVDDFITLFKSVSELANDDSSMLEEADYPGEPQFFLLNRNDKDGAKIDLLDELEGMACELFIGSNGSCNWDNIEAIRKKGFKVYAGEKDSFGWLTGVVECAGKKLLYG